MKTSDWKTININSIFDISYGNKLDMCQMTVKKGGIPFVTRTATNNGIGDYVEELSNVETYPANCLTIALGGSIGSTFLQKEPFYTSQNVAVMKPKEKLSKGVLLFLATIIEKECNKRFVAFGRELNKHIKKDFTIKLPLIADDTPDWKKIDRLVNSIMPKLPGRSLSVWNNNFDKSPVKKDKVNLSDRPWQWFVFGDLIEEPYKAIPYSAYTLTECSHEDTRALRYITRTDTNNGCAAYVLEDDFADIEEGNVITIGDTTSTIFYQSSSFICGDHIIVIRAPWLNKYTGLFITTLLNKERFRYNYGRAYLKESVMSTRVKLPADAAGNPDWQFMEDYIKSLPYSANL